MNLYDALASAIYVAKRSLNGVTINTDDQRLRASGLYAEWAAGVHKTGEVFNCKQDTNFSPEEYPQAWEVYDG